MKKHSLKKMFIVYGVVVLVGCILFPAVWGASGGFVGGNLFSDPLVRSEMIKLIGPKSTDGAKEFLEKLPPDKRNAIEMLVKEQYKKINWLPVHLIVNLVVFSILGFLMGIVFKEFLFTGIIPIGMLFVTLPVLSSGNFLVINMPVTITIALLSQFIIVYLFSYIGYKIRN